MAMRRNGGFILPLVIFALAVMGILLLVLLRTSDDDRMGSRYVLEGTRSFYAAESGLNKIIAAWITNGYGKLAPTVGSSADLGWQTIPENKTRYHGVILKLTANTWQLTVDGQSGEARRGLRTVQVILEPSATFDHAVYANVDLKFSGGGTDSYDSGIGAYGGANLGTNGDIGTNGTISQLSGSTTIGGNAGAVGAVAGGCASNSHVLGTCTSPGPSQTLADVSCPAGYSAPSDIPNGAGITYSSSTGDLTVSGGKTLTLNYAKGPFRFHNITLSGGSILTFTGSLQHVDMFVGGQLDWSGGTLVNPGKPTDFTLWGCGGDASSWVISGGSGARLALYAPHHQLTVSGGGDVYGALVVGSLVNSGGSMIHYDEALGQQGVTAVVSGSWTEIGR